ncbi:hypothetical protein CO115_02230 [Candidatus Falkowbacteria bacterium CG_4_9_14_3_um_filter_36_9]|uniref:O-antigen ligase-related domain-containing protein n=2 Tax=Candidatus Falkowiibacteriota TaxID=1752728 RepID=A0A1J4TBE8_9BACT|nr:MAG: hypothetical protein AUJ27_00190 [Candidatus Falkowbacteria bacterium CG1_02_37_44]PIV51990.1 MAG: hypothetical protein COS18_01115 [Candidatus Falkowbacteria bacterium CG02_land_8_20_14_3_00_36_14]PJA11323.1 MAG: hypothetical protein COX67_00415 [Candidatus Falkowbacteria bacterium CG_4_10_14_0_2_um_filter_36_22]PJB19801.1 MAG: hypothetical protein CO115_02230 [Candidatus Falkowbacteria bacterium CG_4_9_14_3_um_filter_36_9]
MSKKTYQLILQIGIYISFLSVFLVFKNLLFPYITSKQITFNIITELLFIIWVAYVVKYPSARPRWSYISFGLIVFFLAVLVSCFTGVDFNLSFWGDVERMLGFFHIFHFLLFYFIIITVFRKWPDWRNLFIVSVSAAALISLYALINNVSMSTIGNTAYVSGYLIFNIYFSFILFFRGKNWLIKSIYPVLALIMLLAFRKADTSGAYVGLAASILVLLSLYLILHKNKKIRIYSSAFLLILVFSVSFIFLNKESALVQGNNFLKNTTREISLNKNTFQTRLISWRAALKDFKNHPILGTGHGNYAITFDKYFEPKFYTFTSSETYFDRAHNNIIDIASTTGAVGLLTYLSIFMAVGYYLILGYRQDKININEFVLISALITAYFIQNLAVFDSLVTYLSLMVVLGFVYWLTNKNEIEEIEEEHDQPLNNQEIYTFAVVGLIVLSILYQYNIKPLKMLIGTIKAQIVLAQPGGDIISVVDIHKKALSYNTVLDRDSRTVLIRLISGNINSLKNIGSQPAKEILDYAISLASANVDYNKEDSLNQLMLAQAYDTAARFSADGNQDTFYHYADRALEAVNESIAASPGRVTVYFSKAQIFMTRGEADKAIDTLKYAVSLNEDYVDSHCNLSRFLLSLGREEEGFQAMDKCIDKGGTGNLYPAQYVKLLINHYAELESKANIARVIKLYELLANNLEPNDAKIWVNLASLYAREGNKDKAIDAARKAIEYDPSIKDAAEDFIKKLEEL